MEGTLREVDRAAVINAVSERRIGGHVSCESVWRIDVRVEVVEGGVRRSISVQRRRNRGRVKERRQRCSAPIEVADAIASILYR